MKLLNIACPIALSIVLSPFAGAMIASVDGITTHNTEPTEALTEIWNRTVTLQGGSSPGTGIYLGKSDSGTYWVLTAAHVAPTAGGISVATAGGETVSLTYTDTHRYLYNEDGTQADLELFSVSASGAAAEYLDSLGNIDIYQGNPVTTPLYCVGTGCSLSLGSGLASGSREKQWGEFCADTGATLSTGGYTTLVLVETFSEKGESIQCGMYDSGSGVFAENNGAWEIVGVTVAISAAQEGASLIGFKDDTSENKIDNPICYTLFAYLPAYASQIYAIIPEPSAFGLLAGMFALGLAGMRRRR